MVQAGARSGLQPLVICSLNKEGSGAADSCGRCWWCLLPAAAQAGFPGSLKAALSSAGFALEVCPSEGLALLPHWGVIGGLGMVLSHTGPGRLG